MAGDLKRCPNCGQFNGSDDTRCISCDADMSKAAAVKTRTSPSGKRRSPKALIYLSIAVVLIIALGWFLSTATHRAVTAGLEQGTQLTEAGDYQQAQEVLQATLNRFEQASQAYQAEYGSVKQQIQEGLAANLLGWGRSLEASSPEAALGHYEAAVDMYADTPSGRTARDAGAVLALRQADAQRDAGGLRDAVRAYAKVMAQFSGTPAAQRAGQQRDEIFNSRSISVEASIGQLRSRDADKEALAATLEEMLREFAQSQGLLLHEFDDPAGPALTLEGGYREAWAARGNTAARLRLTLQSAEGSDRLWREELKTELEGRVAWGSDDAAASDTLRQALEELSLPEDVLG